jgi:hypothetical protein
MSQDLTTADIAQRGGSAAPVRADATEAAAGTTRTEQRTALFETTESDRLRSRWAEVQTEFVDSPQQAVQDADALVAELMQHLAETFARERDALERQWVRGEDVTTEDLRVSLTRYRSFFERLLDA